jgi:hypothetical protein
MVWFNFEKGRNILRTPPDEETSAVCLAPLRAQSLDTSLLTCAALNTNQMVRFPERGCDHRLKLSGDKQ